MDVVLLRQDPSTMAYLTTIYPGAPAQDDFGRETPRLGRNAPEENLPGALSRLDGTTLITRTRAAIRAFREHHKDIILKPLYGNGGAGVFAVPAR